MRDITEFIRAAHEGDDEQAKAMRAQLGPYSDYIVWELEGYDGAGIWQVVRYVQMELSVFQKQEFARIAGTFIDDFVSGELGIDLRQIFTEGSFRSRIEIPNTPDEAQALVEDESNIDLIRGILKILDQLPVLQHELFLIALGVPTGQRDFAKRIMTGPVYLGGFTEKQYTSVIVKFIEQNVPAIRAFFSQGAEEIATAFRKHVLGDDAIEGKATETETETKTKAETLPEPASAGGMP